MPDEPIRVLLIEDNPGDARLVQLALAESRAMRFEVRSVASMSDALNVIATGNFNVVLLDLSLPDCARDDTMERVTAATLHTPIVVLTGLDDEEFSRSLVKSGAQDYLIKGQFDGRLLARSLTYAIERKRTERELATARDGALEASKQTSGFLATMSHEIRTPMNAIIGMTEMLLDTPLDAEQREFVSTVWSSGLALLAIINDILDFSKVSTDKLTLHDVEFRPSAALESVIELLAERCQTPDLRLVSFVDGGMPVSLLGDSGRLRQVLTNLVGNAIKFTEHGEIAVLARRQSETAEEVTLHFTVNDTGPGISSEFQARIFDAFYQTDSASTRRHGGTGLGLAISSQIVELMGGKLKVESVPGSGSSFSFSARFRKPAGVCETEEHAHAGLHRKRVLVVDPDATAAQWLCRQLCSWGLECEVVRTSAEALQVLARSHATAGDFHCAILDLDRGGLNGIELARAIHADATLRQTRLIAIHKFGRRLDHDALTAAGFSSWTSNPVRQSQIFDCIAAAIAESDSGAQISDSSWRQSGPRASLNQLSSAVPLDVRAHARILSVDDHLVNQSVVLKMLERLGYHGDRALDGLQAVEAVRRHDYDLILMDCQMPTMDGYAAARAIRREFRERRIIIIGLTANALDGDREKCLEAGMDDYLSKPLSAEALAETLARWLAPPQRALKSGAVDPPAEAEAPIATAIDMRAISEFAASDESGEEFLTNIIAVFLADMGERVRAAGVQMRHDDNIGLAATAHALRGSSGHFGAARLIQLCGAIEDKVRSKQTARIGAAVDSMIAEAERVRVALKAFRFVQPPAVDQSA